MVLPHESSRWKSAAKSSAWKRSWKTHTIDYSLQPANPYFSISKKEGIKDLDMPTWAIFPFRGMVLPHESSVKSNSPFRNISVEGLRLANYLFNRALSSLSKILFVLVTILLSIFLKDTKIRIGRSYWVIDSVCWVDLFKFDFKVLFILYKLYNKNT